MAKLVSVSSSGDRFGVAISGQTGGKLVGEVEQPGITGVGREEDELADGDNTPVVIGGLVLDVANLVGQAEALAVHHCLACPRLIVLRPTVFLSIGIVR